MIANLSDLQKLLKLLRKQGVQTFKMGEIELKLGDLPIERASVNQDQDNEDDLSNPYGGFPEGILTETQAIHYANGGIPENDPELNRQ